MVTCGAVHHGWRHAVLRRLRVHEAGAVVHGLAVGRAGSHEAALVHAGETALPGGREHNTHILMVNPQQPVLGLAAH